MILILCEFDANKNYSATIRFTRQPYILGRLKSTNHHTARPKLRDVFHQLLFALACFDMTFIVCGGVNYTFRAFKVGQGGFIKLRSCRS